MAGTTWLQTPALPPAGPAEPQHVWPVSDSSDRELSGSASCEETTCSHSLSHFGGRQRVPEVEKHRHAHADAQAHVHI